jgi:hypothetical protein
VGWVGVVWLYWNVHVRDVTGILKFLSKVVTTYKSVHNTNRRSSRTDPETEKGFGRVPGWHISVGFQDGIQSGQSLSQQHMQWWSSHLKALDSDVLPLLVEVLEL